MLEGLAREVRGLVVVTVVSGEGQEATVTREQLARLLLVLLDTLLALLGLTCCLLGPERWTSVKVTALVGVFKSTVLVESTAVSSMLSRSFMGRSLCLRGEEGGVEVGSRRDLGREGRAGSEMDSREGLGRMGSRLLSK